MQYHLFSNIGEPFAENIRQIVGALLAGDSQKGEAHLPNIAYLPAASVYRRWIRETQVALRGLGRLATLNVETAPRAHLLATLERASLLYIPGGNTYLLAQRLHASGIFAEIETRIRAGLPVVTFSAGTVLCGQDILTTNDINCCACTHFTGLGLAPVNFNVHFPAQEAGTEREARLDRLLEYQVFHDTPVLALEDGAYLRGDGIRLELVRGNAWWLKKGRPLERFALEDAC